MDYKKLSIKVAYALRHGPEGYGLYIDREGWADIELLLSSFRRSKEWEMLGKEDLYKMIEKSDKKRFEILGDKIRALYGHSLPEKILKESSSPPEILYHGTARGFLQGIKSFGLLPKGRQYVHLSTDIETALSVGKRRDEKPILLKIQALKAYEQGIKFYHGNSNIWLADNVPSKYISHE